MPPAPPPYANESVKSRSRVNLRLEEHQPCLLVLIGVRADGRKELIALTDGYRESAES
ncbi:hypothetical protein [Nonomuraea diastatica]|uniref:hypothetical protein n=1 Tax=Nonomuraea diastatica TaxID=1848329 RepID=UPI00140C95B0|nr:hypothetical protein [Nonomuraea diastatica]